MTRTGVVLPPSLAVAIGREDGGRRLAGAPALRPPSERLEHGEPG